MIGSIFGIGGSIFGTPAPAPDPGGVTVEDGDPITVENADGSVSATATIEVAGGTLTGATLPDTHALVTSGELAGVTVSGEYTETVTLTVEGGVVTAITLS